MAIVRTNRETCFSPKCNKHVLKTKGWPPFPSQLVIKIPCKSSSDGKLLKIYSEIKNLFLSTCNCLSVTLVKINFCNTLCFEEKKKGHSVLLHSAFHSIFPPITSHVESVKLAVDFYHSRLHHIHVTVSFSRFYVLNIEIWSLFSAIDFFVLWFQPIMNVILLLSNANDLL